MSKVVDRPLAGNELVLVAQVPKAGTRWTQVHFNKDVVRQFFRTSEGEERTLTFERVDRDGSLMGSVDRRLVLSSVNLNPKIELDFGMREGRRPDYPEESPPVAVILELDPQTFRYQTLLPGEVGYAEMLDLTKRGESLGRGLRRVITNLDEVELRWPGCRLRSPVR